MSRRISTREARRRGRLMWRALVAVTIGMFTLRVVWAVFAAFSDDPQNMPGWLWALAALVGPAALAVYWRPAYRVPQCLFHTGFASLVLGMGGAGWGSIAAPVISGATILGLCFVPRDGGWRARWGRDEPDAQRP